MNQSMPNQHKVKSKSWKDFDFIKWISIAFLIVMFGGCGVFAIASSINSEGKCLSQNMYQDGLSCKPWNQIPDSDKQQVIDDVAHYYADKYGVSYDEALQIYERTLNYFGG